MADLTTYAGLQAAVADWLGRDDLTERLPVFIALCEKRMDRELRLRCKRSPRHRQDEHGMLERVDELGTVYSVEHHVPLFALL